MNANSFEIDYANNRPLQEIFSRLRPGQTVELKLKLRLVSSDEQGAKLQIVKVTSPGTVPKTLDPDEDGSVSPDANAPAMMVMRASQGGSQDETQTTEET